MSCQSAAPVPGNLQRLENPADRGRADPVAELEQLAQALHIRYRRAATMAVWSRRPPARHWLCDPDLPAYAVSGVPDSIVGH
jgi:hypothetical protein